MYGKDCMVVGTDTTRAADQRIPSLFEGDGLENEDWFGWKVELLAPCDGLVRATSDNPRTNRPGQFPDRDTVEPASEIRFTCNDGTRVVYAHTRDLRVARGDCVAAGDVVAAIGNNAVSKAPHVHSGWGGATPHCKSASICGPWALSEERPIEGTGAECVSQTGRRACDTYRSGSLRNHLRRGTSAPPVSAPAGPTGMVIPPGYRAYVVLGCANGFMVGVLAGVVTELTIPRATLAWVVVGASYGLVLWAAAHHGYLPFRDPE